MSQSGMLSAPGTDDKPAALPCEIGFYTPDFGASPGWQRRESDIGKRSPPRRPRQTSRALDFRILHQVVPQNIPLLTPAWIQEPAYSGAQFQSALSAHFQFRDDAALPSFESRRHQERIVATISLDPQRNPSSCPVF